MAVKRKRRKPKSSAVAGRAVSGMPDGAHVSDQTTTRDDVESAYAFVKKQKRRTPPK